MVGLEVACTADTVALAITEEAMAMVLAGKFPNIYIYIYRFHILIYYQSILDTAVATDMGTTADSDDSMANLHYYMHQFILIP